MIDTAIETLVPLARVAAQLRAQGLKTHISTPYRWSVSGCRGVILETIQVGATRCTSVLALQRFFERLTEGSRRTPTFSRSVVRRNRQSEAAAKELERLGV